MILGAGFGGLAVATELGRLLDDGHEIVLVDRREHFSMGLRKLWEVVGLGTIAEGSRARSELAGRGIRFLRREVTTIEPGSRVAVLDDETLEWRVEIAGVERGFVTDILSQQPDARVAWASRGGEDHAGAVTFQALDPTTTRVDVQMEYDPEAWTDKVADALKVIDLRVRGDLKRFKERIEEQGAASGAWRGTIVGGERVDEPDQPLDQDLLAAPPEVDEPLTEDRLLPGDPGDPDERGQPPLT